MFEKIKMHINSAFCEMIWSLIRCKETDIADDAYVVATKRTIAVIEIFG